MDQGETVGLLTLENVGEFLMVREALAGEQEHSRQSSQPSSPEPNLKSMVDRCVFSVLPIRQAPRIRDTC